MEGLINFAKLGLGIIEAPEEYVNVQPNELVQVLPDIDSPSIEIYYSYSKLTKGSSKIRAFENFVQECLGEANKGNKGYAPPTEKA